MFADILAPFQHVLFNLGSEGVTVSEVLGFVTGLGTVYLTVRQSVVNFPIGILNNLFFFILFFSAALYADAWLQVVYLALACMGWVTWLKAGPNRTELKVSSSGFGLFLMTLVGVVAATAILYPILKDAHDIAPFWDALTTALSLGAQFLLNFKKIQNWFLWIAADIIYIPLYGFKELYLTAIVYVFFLGLCFVGLRQWSLAYRAQDPERYDSQVLFPVSEAA